MMYTRPTRKNLILVKSVFWLIRDSPFNSVEETNLKLVYQTTSYFTMEKIVKLNLNFSLRQAPLQTLC
uniref:Uncharacterized protein n=1 Tax=Anguilla anguilla TaxID=7936 RepID=A0A0E9QTI0_ANGAN